MSHPAGRLPEPLVVPVGRANLAGVRLGAGGWPSIVFLHAGIADHRSWRGVLDRLTPDMDGIAYDRRGFGITTCAPEAHDQVGDLVAVLDACGCERAVLVGNSMGGQVALDAALAHPDRVAALVLVAPTVSGAPATQAADMTPEALAIWDTLEAADAAGDLQALNEGEIRLWLDGPLAPEGRVDGEARVLALDMNRMALAAEVPGHEPNVTDAWSRLDQLSCPVLVVVGDLDLAHLQRRCRHLVELIPGATLAVLDGTAHLPALEQPAAFADLLCRFVSEHLPPAPADPGI
jgi:pimeloyl-ACP methyl ester carboxylesterase